VDATGGAIISDVQSGSHSRYNPDLLFRQPVQLADQATIRSGSAVFSFKKEEDTIQQYLYSNAFSGGV
jgi:hypothetical protein